MHLTKGNGWIMVGLGCLLVAVCLAVSQARSGQSGATAVRRIWGVGGVAASALLILLGLISVAAGR